MQIKGEYTIPSDVKTVWDAINDPEVLAQAIPGCENLEKVGDNAFKANVTSKIGPITAKFSGDVELQDLNPPYSYTLVGAGSAGGMGSAKGNAKVTLEDVEGSTKLTYAVDAQVTGKIAQLGGRLIESTTKVLAGHFFKKLIEIISGEKVEEAGTSKSRIMIYVGIAVVTAILIFMLL